MPKSAISLLVLIVLLAAVACASLPQQTDESYAVYSAYLNFQLTHNAHDYGTGNGLLLIQQATSTTDLQPGGISHLKEDLKGLDDSTLKSFQESARESVVLERKFTFRTPYVIATEAAIASGRTRSDYGYLVLSRVGFNLTKTQALFRIEHNCGLCGGIGYVLMKKSIFGKWKIQSEYFPIMS